MTQPLNNWFNLGAIVEVNGNGIAMPRRPFINVLPGAGNVTITAADNPSGMGGQGSTDITIAVAASGTTPDTLVFLNHANSPPGSPVTLTPYAQHVIDCSAGAVGVTLPSGMAAGAYLSIKMAVGKAVTSFTCNAVAASTVEVPLDASNGSVPVTSPGTTASEFVFNVAGFAAAGLGLTADGSNNFWIRPL